MADTSTTDPKLTTPPTDETGDKQDGVEGETTTTDAPGGEATQGTGDDAVEEGSVNDASKTNGHVEQAETVEHPDNQETAGQDTEMNTANNPVTGSRSSLRNAAGNNGMPASAKKSNAATKKKSSAIPEHKTKKLNKKKSRPILHLDAKPGELYLARMKGHQPWPSVICDEEMLPQILISTRPITTAQPDGTFRKPEYEDGGKRANERTYPIMFLQTNEFAWIVNTELTPLSVEECQDATEKGKSKNLIEAYKVAAQGYDLAYFKEMLADHMHAIQEDNEARAEREAKKANKAKRKSIAESAAAESAADAEAMDVDEEAGEMKPKSKKRKKSLDSEGTDEKPAKTPKTSTKLKLSTPKTPTAEFSTKKKGAKQTKASAKKSAAKVDASDDEQVDTPKVEETLTPAAAKDKKEKEIRYYRHKLQKGFLSRDTVPKDDEIKILSTYLGKLEEHPDLEGSIIRATKIHKVLKAMIRLSSIPKDEEFHFKKRSHELLQKWNKILQEDPTASAADKEDDAKPDAPTNGVGKEIEEEPTKEEAEEGVAPEDNSKEDLENKIGTTVEGAKEPKSTNADKEANSTNPETDEPNVESAPEETYQPPAETTETTA